MRYCARCLYPENAKPAIIFDDEGVCSGCRYHESREGINWREREKKLSEILEEYKKKARKKSNPYDCIVPVSGGKDSHYQVWLLKEVYGMNPLLVTFNHGFNSYLGLENLRNLVNKSGCDLLRFTANPHSVKKVSRYMLKKVGDLTWHYHAGIRTLPFQVAVKYKIPLIVWGEHGFAELTGMFTLDDMVEFTKWTRQEHDMRGFEPEDLINKESGVTGQDIVPYIYPTDEEIERINAKGIYLSNFVYWNAKDQADLMIKKWGFKQMDRPRDRTFVLYAKIDDHANDVHDFLKYLKFGYGRTTDDASMEIRHGRMTREEGIKLVNKYDHVVPRTLNTYLRFLGISEKEFYDAVEPMRDLNIWQKNPDGTWETTDSVANHLNDPEVENARVRQVNDRTFSKRNEYLYYNPFKKKARIKNKSASEEFIIL
ncbi:MAG: N-acetyl sugar amidotransferase [Candidatus Curtissbacteria bacterium GW2011_GWA1_40_47]|uniref:N-acetyl sugar amidotransferase n=1 Tax=Candidatus Curtissbacteria bacterium RIFOXYA1_FULL_41_14 TaxID=1797737 RepID=A0A1F5HAT0_9BACT|nr:MAG: N-acetyl sugar amidotransferase [Candidatus Curtissbacteria bacterium GW2011_GWB1_40_28]KKR62359.1 MAG: N-acetyl sugar amidotransferase [Microgenomates group bacterium GW2011_GWC1_40_35]KKR66440.1 MAG: N-acetyl sugar amidotransferase [Candidatus Curtissbacteria bacterium GW2011_GWA1_40_47]KKR77900.1 MAG: N-acetyl sugar amidotransferase [Candidatus Curtissbacteria bacterium GW2011_GWD1_40_8]KKS02527.1 MAG: N-acetyl sugar amidotransferase [Candidatus Curtissbacteria bacterium GW2011_GWC2_